MTKLKEHSREICWTLLWLTPSSKEEQRRPGCYRGRSWAFDRIVLKRKCNFFENQKLWHYLSKKLFISENNEEFSWLCFEDWMIEYPKICQVTSLAGGHTRLIYLQQPLLPREIQDSGLLLAFWAKQLIRLDGLNLKQFFCICYIGKIYSNWNL